MSEVKRKEIRGPLDRGTFRVMLREDIPDDGNVLPGRFVLSIKSTDDGEVKWKARYVIGGHRDKLKIMMVHTSQNLQPSSVRLLLSLAEFHGFRTWTSDVTQAYLQSKEQLMRDFFVDHPVPEFELDPDQCLQLLKPFYGLCESGDLWHKTLDGHHKDDMGMSPMRADPAVYVIMRDVLLSGLSGTYVDDMIRAGDEHFENSAEDISERFRMAEDSYLVCSFTGFLLKREDAGCVQLSQSDYPQKLKPLPEDYTYAQFASLRMKLPWFAQSRPDCLREISQMTQVTRSRLEDHRREIIRRVNKTVQYGEENPAAI